MHNAVTEERQSFDCQYCSSLKYEQMEVAVISCNDLNYAMKNASNRH